MEIVLAAVVAAVVSGGVVLFAQRTATRSGVVAPVAGPSPRPAPAPVRDGREPPPKERAEPAAAPAESVSDIEHELRERRAELARAEERILGKEASVDAQLTELERRERSLEDRGRNLEHQAEELKQARQRQLRELERIAGLSVSQAKQILLKELEDELRHESAVLIRHVEEEARRDADRRARSILSTVMQRVAGGHAAETTVSVVQLDSDEMKGRIIGREGRNIRALETPDRDRLHHRRHAVGGDPVRLRRRAARDRAPDAREAAPGRPHPPGADRGGLLPGEVGDREPRPGGRGAGGVRGGIGSLHPELTKLLGRLHYRTSYGQNVLAHSIECAKLAGLLADELGASSQTATRAALLHDIGKAVTHEIEGPHALVGGDLARRYKEAEAVAHAMESHHNEVEPQTVEAVIVQVVDALSGARPGARGESLENYVKRLRELEEIALRQPGVEKVYAMHAGREIRVVVKPEDVDDDKAALLSHTIARTVEKELEYPGQVKVTVIRESRATDYAK